MIAITGANGQLGQKVITSLLHTIAPQDVVALVRSPETVSYTHLTLPTSDLV